MCLAASVTVSICKRAILLINIRSPLPAYSVARSDLSIKPRGDANDDLSKNTIRAQCGIVFEGSLTLVTTIVTRCTASFASGCLVIERSCLRDFNQEPCAHVTPVSLSGERNKLFPNGGGRNTDFCSYLKIQENRIYKSSCNSLPPACNLLLLLQ